MLYTTPMLSGMLNMQAEIGMLIFKDSWPHVNNFWHSVSQTDFLRYTQKQNDGKYRRTLAFPTLESRDARGNEKA